MKILLKKYLSYCLLLPLGVFVWVARYQGLFSETAKSDAWQYPFYYASVVALLIIGLHFILNVPLNRMFLSVNIFLIGSAVLFLIKNEFLLSLLSKYSGAAFFLAMILTGLLTIFSKDKFISDPAISPAKNLLLSRIMILGCILAFLWSLVFNNCGILISIAVPFAMLRLVSMILIMKMKKH